MPRKASEANSIQKVCSVLKTLGHSELRLMDIAERCSLNKTTVFRILAELDKAGFCEKNDQKRTYRLGPEAVAIAAVADRSSNLRAAAAASLAKLAESTGETSLLCIRSGTEMVCLDRQTGSFPNQADYLRVGTRMPLGTTSGAMVLLAAIPASTIPSILDHVERHLPDYPKLHRSQIEREIDPIRSQGFSVRIDGVVEGIGGIAVPVRSRNGRVAGAIALAGRSNRILDRQGELLRTLRGAAQEITRSQCN